MKRNPSTQGSRIDQDIPCLFPVLANCLGGALFIVVFLIAVTKGHLHKDILSHATPPAEGNRPQSQSTKPQP